ncbi:MAG: bifunctional 4-hydroxy-3-methylbut-2-enyl diphosphate reductase/30S ribosomal protein S1 [Clostridia bacterium]|nr:bifunctional 4-hydroxy-3-methylbut-2-enyl diphosphate reductase/30S ribosomal protein S1 [Clostridia bacterium]
MQVVVAKNSGFCSGVKKAVETAMSVSPENTFVYGEIIHNREVVNEIKKRGLITVDDVSKVPDGATLLIRSHGAEKFVYEECAKRNIRLIDCTCAFVKKSRDIVKRASDEGKTVVITGSREHPEIRGLVGWTSGEVFVFASAEEDFSVLGGKEVVLISQTTFSEKSFSKIAENIQKVRPKTVEIFPTICYTTICRQREAEELSRICDAVLVIGGLNSSNTNKLTEIASANCKRVIRLRGADDFEYEKIKGCKKVGVIAGASTPDWQTREVLCKMEENSTEVQKMTMQNVVEDIDKNERYHKGQIISAKIVSATEEGVYVSASGKLEILLPKDELDCSEYTREAYAGRVGEELQLMVVELNPKVKLSEKSVKKIKEEEALLGDVEAGKEFSVICTGFNKGGLTAELGTYPVFIPAKEIRSGYVNDLEKYKGKKLRLRLLEIRKERRKEIIASQRVILEEEKAAKDAQKAEKEEAFFNTIEVGAIVEGKVERVTSFGAFVSVNGFDCLAHISDLSWTGVKEVTDVLEIGKRYQFKVLKIDRENKKVSIGYKQLQPEPWDLAAEKYAEGDVVHGKVVRIVPFGAFVELEKGIDGLVHVSQISHEWLENPTSVLSIGEEIDAKVLAFNPAERKITLSIKALQPQPEVEAHYTKEKDRDEGKGNNRKARKGGKKNFSDDDEEYREWNEGGFGGVSIADLLNGENK